ncbi:MAG: cytochrome c biogenesis protein CcsA [Planctomycetota bacterium]|jgi:ABC-type transport system involved in cytochrome c biogenesis permease subunit
MAIKYNILGLLIYMALAMYLLAFVMMLLRFNRTAKILYFLGFAVMLVTFGYRWYQVQHIPLQNLFEVFLALGVLIYPLSLFCRRLLGVEGEITDPLIGAILLIPAGFIFNAEPQKLPPALQSWLFTPHVAVYMLSYVIMAKAAVQAIYQLLGSSVSKDKYTISYEQATYRMVCLGFPLLTLGLLLGSWWGKLAWGDYWGWDPKEMWSLASWLVYVGYFHFRYMFGKKHSSINSIWVVMGIVVICITLLWVNLSNLFTGLHSYAM